jgi:hypothetical protein
VLLNFPDRNRASGGAVSVRSRKADSSPLKRIRNDKGLGRMRHG